MWQVQALQKLWRRADPMCCRSSKGDVARGCSWNWGWIRALQSLGTVFLRPQPL